MNSAKYPLIITACLYLLFLCLQLSELNCDHTRFIMAGDYFVNAKKVPGHINILQNSLGYDGQFYYRLALDPFTDKIIDHGIEIDDPPWRQRRIIYPLLTWLLSFGKAGAASWVLIILNYLALCFTGWIGGKYAVRSGLHALWGMAFPMYAGFVITLTRNLAEILEVSLIIATFYLLKENKYISATITLTLTVFTKEPSLLIAWAAFIVYIAGLWRKNDKTNNIKWYFPIIPGAAHVIWHVWLYYHWNTSLVGDIRDKIGMPFAGFFKLFVKNAPFADYPNYICFTELSIILIFTISILLSYRTSSANLTEKLSWLHYLLLAICLTGRHYWITDGEFLRALSEFHIIGIMLLMNSRFLLRKFILLLNIAFCIYLAVLVVYYPDVPRYSRGEKRVATNPVEELLDKNFIYFNLSIDPLHLRYRAGEKLDLYLDAKSPLAKKKVDIYFVMIPPDKNGIFFASRWGKHPKPVLANCSVPADITLHHVSLLHLSLPAVKPLVKSPGLYTFAIGASKPDTLDFVSNIATINLNVAP